MLIRIGSLTTLVPIIIFAAELNFVASVNRTEVGLGEPLLLTVSVEGDDIGQVPSPQLPGLPDFDIGGTSTSQSTNIQMVGGKVIKRQLINFIYTLYPKEIGKTAIGACKLQFKGEIHQTQPIEINVVKASTQPSQPAPGITPAPAEPSVAIGDNLKLVATVNRKSVYQGELVVVDYSLYTRLRLADINLSEAPTFSGFWVEPIFDAQRIEFQRKAIAGKVYDVSVLKKSALFPMTTGRLRIAPMKLDVAVVQSPRDFFDFFGTTKIVTLASDVIFIDVILLPTEGKPEEFTGGVGRFTIDASLDQTSSRAAEPINLTVKISGAGNLKLLEKPLMPALPGVKVLDPEVRESTDYSEGSIRGYKEFSYPLIPQTDGEHIVPSIEIAYFDPSDKKYHRIATEQLRFTATQTASAVESAQTGGLKTIGADIKYIKTDAVRLNRQKFSAGWWIAFLYFASFVVIGAAIAYRRHQARLLTDRAYARKLRSSRRVRKGLEEAQHHLKNDDEKAFHAALSKVILGYIGDRYNLDTGSMMNQDIMEELKQRNISEETIRKLGNLLNQCDMRFSPGMKCENPQTLFLMVRDLLGEL